MATGLFSYIDTKLAAKFTAATAENAAAQLVQALAQMRTDTAALDPADHGEVSKWADTLVASIQAAADGLQMGEVIP